MLSRDSCTACERSFSHDKKRLFILPECEHKVCADCVEKNVAENQGKQMICPVDGKAGLLGGARDTNGGKFSEKPNK